MPNIGDTFKTLEEERLRLNNEVRERTISYIIAAFGLVAGLAWNDAITSLIEYLFPVSAGSLFAKFIYAIVITIVVVVTSIYLARIFNKKNSP